MKAELKRAGLALLMLGAPGAAEAGESSGTVTVTGSTAPIPLNFKLDTVITETGKEGLSITSKRFENPEMGGWRADVACENPIEATSVETLAGVAASQSGPFIEDEDTIKADPEANGIHQVIFEPTMTDTTGDCVVLIEQGLNQ